MEEVVRNIEEGGEERPIFRDIRRYYCEYCGICRSKKSIITSHILKDHQEEMNQEGAGGDAEVEVHSNTCQECGASFRKPAYLKQHIQSHSLEVLIPGFLLSCPYCSVVQYNQVGQIH